MRSRLAAVAVLLGLSLATVPVVGQQAKTAAQKLPPLSYVCTMPGDEGVLEDKPGICPNPKCKMPLVPIRLDAKYWCPTHQTLVVRDGPGTCPLDKKTLVPVTLSEFWTCADKPDDKLIDPGNCANGQPRKIGYELRAHGDHNPRHGGQFFMAEDAWHHMEGTYPTAALFRAFFYDNYTKPMNPKAFSGSVIVLDKADKELGTFPLTVARDGATLEAKIPPALGALPFKAAAKVKFAPELREQRFDFNFAEFSKDTAAPATPPATPAPKPATTTANPPAPARPAAAKPVPPTAAAKPAPAPAAPTPAPAPASQEPLILDSPTQIPPALAEALDESKLPTNTQGLLAELTSRAKDVQTLVNEGNLAQVWLPATATKTVALVLDANARSLPERQRVLISSAVKRVVTSAWELDAYGDLGNKEKITEAYQRLESAVTDLKAAYETR